MNWSVSKDVQLLKLWIENNRDSAMAFQRGRLKREGGTPVSYTHLTLPTNSRV